MKAKSSFLTSALTAVFVWFGSVSITAQTLSGTIVDVETEETLAFANIIIGQDFAVITNDEGNFEIDISKFTAKDSVSVSYLGYKTQKFAIKDFSKDPIALEPEDNLLSEVFIIDKNLDPLDILEEVNENLNANYSSVNSHFVVFERSKYTFKVNNSALEINKADVVDKNTLNTINKNLARLSHNAKGVVSTTYFDSFFDLYKNEKDSLKIQFIKGTKLINSDKNMSADELHRKAFGILGEKLQTRNTFSIRSGNMPLSGSVDLKNSFKKSTNTDSLNLKSKNRDLSKIFSSYGFGKHSEYDFLTDYDKYSYEIIRAFNYNGDLVYVLQFKPKGRGKYEGEVYISAATYAVLKTNYKPALGKSGAKLNLKLLMGVKFEEPDKQVLAIYTKTNEQHYSLKYLKTRTAQSINSNRSFTFTENDKPKDEHIKLNLDLFVEGFATNEEEFLIITSDRITTEEFDKVDQPARATIQIIEKFDPEIWAPYTIITPTQALKDFEN